MGRDIFRSAKERMVSMSDMVDSDLRPYMDDVKEESYIYEKQIWLRTIGRAKESLKEIAEEAFLGGHYERMLDAKMYVDEIGYCEEEIRKLEDKDENVLIDYDRYVRRAYLDYGENAEFTAHKKLKARHEERRNWKHQHTTNRRTSIGR